MIQVNSRAHHPVKDGEGPAPESTENSLEPGSCFTANVVTSTLLITDKASEEEAETFMY